VTNSPDDPGPLRGGPLQLDYEQPSAPEQRRHRMIKILALCIIAGWLPFVCGIVTGAAAVRSGSELIIHQHLTGQIFFMALGILVSTIGAIGMIRARSLTGALFGGAVIALQLCIAICAGVARL
jgi:uncharacterized membrane protein YedE/YeeE